MAHQPPAPRHFWGRPSAQPTVHPSSQTSSYLPSLQQPPAQNPPPPHTLPAPPFAYSSPQPASNSNTPPSLTPPSTSNPFVPQTSVFSAAPPRGDPVRLFHDKRDEERNGEAFEDMSAVFSVITATERLENIWARRSAISNDDYERHCEHLIQQYNVLKTSPAVPKLDMFIVEYGVKANRARTRLTSGVPATVMEPGRGGALKKEQNKFVLRCTSLFHHLGNCIDMGQVQVGDLLPDLISLMKTLSRISALDANFEFGAKIRAWVERLNAMQAAEELTSDDATQLKLDLDNGFTEFELAIND